MSFPGFSKQRVFKSLCHLTVSPQIGNTLFSPQFNWGGTVSKLVQGSATQAVEEQGRQALERALGDKASDVHKILEGSNQEKEHENARGDKKSDRKPADVVKRKLKGVFDH